MRINDINKASQDIKSRIQGNVQNDGDTTKVFQRELTSLNHENHEIYINSLVDKITIQGEKITNKADLSELQKYRELIVKLLNENVSNSFVFEKSDQFDSRGKHKVFTMIRNVNQKLDKLTSEVLKEQIDNITVINLVDDIRGILVDLFL